MFGTCCCFCGRDAGGHDDNEDKDDQLIQVESVNNMKWVSQSKKRGSTIPVARSSRVERWGLRKHHDGDNPMKWCFYTKRCDGRLLYINYDEKADRVETNIWRPNSNRFFIIRPSLREGCFLIQIPRREKYFCVTGGKLGVKQPTGDGSDMMFKLDFSEPGEDPNKYKQKVDDRGTVHFVEVLNKDGFKLLSKGLRPGSQIPVQPSVKDHPWCMSIDPFWIFHVMHDGKKLYITSDADDKIEMDFRGDERYFDIIPSTSAGLFLIKHPGKEKYLKHEGGFLKMATLQPEIVKEMEFMLCFGDLGFSLRADIEICAANHPGQWINPEPYDKISVASNSTSHIWRYHTADENNIGFSTSHGLTPNYASYHYDSEEIIVAPKSENYNRLYTWKGTKERPAVPSILQTATIRGNQEEQTGPTEPGRYVTIQDSSPAATSGHLSLTGDESLAQEWNAHVCGFSLIKFQHALRIGENTN